MSFTALRYSDIPGLERSINDAYRVASQRLLNVFLEKFNLLNHLLALKHYLMLGYGDFADQLMEALGWIFSILILSLFDILIEPSLQAKSFTPRKCSVPA